MGLYSQTIKNLVSGISQQPPVLRLPEQLAEQINGFSTESEGLQTRPPSLHIAELDASILVPGTKPLIHLINRDTTERYVVIFNGTGVAVYDVYGNRKTVTYGSGAQAYLATTSPREVLKAVTVADFTFVVNTEVVAEMTSAVTTDVWATQGALINVKSGQYGRTYRIILNGGQVATFTTPDGSVSSHVTQIDTNYIANQLATAVNAVGGYTANNSGEGWLYITKNSGAITSVETKDGYNNQAMYGFLTTAQKFSQLPATAPDGFTVKIKGDPGADVDDYYIKYVAADKAWVECAKPGISYAFNAASMPHVLVRQADGSFLFKMADWSQRKAGDDDSNPVPSFIGETINDVFFYRNRLGLLAGENVIESKAGEFFQFWMASATTVLDTDPIDVAASCGEVAILKHAVNLSDELLLWSDTKQFVQDPEGVLTPKTSKIDPTTSYECSPNCKPVEAGRNVYFIAERAKFSSVKEYYAVQDVTDVKNAQDISSHVPSYIPNGVHKLMSSTVENILLALTEGAEDTIFAYKYLFLNEQRAQASWSKWTFAAGTTILGGGFAGATLYLVLKRGAGLFLEKMQFTYNTKDTTGELYRVFLDRKVTTSTFPTLVYDAINDRTTIKLRDVYNADLPLAEYGVVTPDGKYFSKVLTDTDGTIILDGDWRSVALTVGEVFKCRIVFSEVMIKTQDERGTKADTEGRLQVINFWVTYSNSGPFVVTVEQTGKPTFTYEMTARMLGHAQNLLGALPLEEGEFKFPVKGNSKSCTISIESTSPTPMALIGAGWEGNYYRRSQRV